MCWLAWLFVSSFLPTPPIPCLCQMLEVFNMLLQISWKLMCGSLVPVHCPVNHQVQYDADSFRLSHLLSYVAENRCDDQIVNSPAYLRCFECVKFGAYLVN